MNNIIPFEKELDFHSKVSEIISISLEREYEIRDEEISGNLIVTGDYKSHEVSTNVIPFSFKIPFEIAITDNIDKETISLEISDFSYDMKDDSKIIVHVELMLVASEKEEIIERGEPFFIPVEEDDNQEDNIEENVIVDSEDNNEVDNGEYVSYKVHVVNKGESIESICSIYHVDKLLLEEYNDLNNVDVGMKIIIPSKDE